MAKEQEYKQQLTEMGIYQKAFDPAIHELCILERQLSRVRRAWKATAPKGKTPSISDPLYAEIGKLQTTILTHRDALGLTPRGLHRLKKTAAEDPAQQQSEITARLDAILERCRAYDL